MDPTYKGLSVPTPTKVRQKGPSFKRPLLIGLGGVLFIILLWVLVTIFSPNTTAISQRTLYRVDSLTTMMKSAQSNIQDDSLAKLNADLYIVILGDYSALSKAIPTAKSSKELTAIKTEETDAATTAKLKTAKVNGKFDSTYKAVLLQKMEAANALAVELKGVSSKSAVKSALTTFTGHLQTYYTQLKAL